MKRAVGNGRFITQLNSQYGSSLNEFSRFHDPRLGASTTGSGRQITTHMINTISWCVNGDNAPTVKKTTTENKNGEVENEYTVNSPDGCGPIYSDTDSCYFSISALETDLDKAVVIADQIAEVVNGSFKDFVQLAFNTQPGFDTNLRVAREIVASSGIFRAKKKYVLLVHDLEGKRVAGEGPKALKTQGSDIKLSSTPEIIRTMLYDVTMMILRGEPKTTVDEYVLDFRQKLCIKSTSDINPLDFAPVNSIKTLDEYQAIWELTEAKGLGNARLPGHVRAAINHNQALLTFNEKNTSPIKNGQKVKVLNLLPNALGFTSIALASETSVLPKWFTDNFEVDLKKTEEKLVDHKLKLTFDPIGWTVPTVQSARANKLLSFDD